MSGKNLLEEPNQDYDIIQQTRDIVDKMTKYQRFSKARRHLMDALNYRQARNDPDLSTTNSNTDTSKFFHFCYIIQTRPLWSDLLFVLSFVYMYLIVAEPNNRLDLSVPLNSAVVGLDNAILLLMILDAFFEIIHKNSWRASKSKKYPFRFGAKIVFISLFVIDNLVFYTKFSTYPIRPFRILRSCKHVVKTVMPYFYNFFCRKTLHSLYSAGKDIIVYLVFYTIIIMTFSIVATHIINLPQDMTYDKFNSNYYNLGTMSFLIYVLASYDAWPDYQLKAIDASNWYYPFFVAFIFLNCFYFVTIPTTVIFASFKSFRSKIVLIDDIKQRNSLLLCFVCLGEKNLSIKSETFHQFMLYVYKNKLRLIDHIKQLSFKLDPNNNSIIYASDFMKLCTLMEEHPHMMPPRFDDWKHFMQLRKWLKQNLHIKRIVNSDIFEGIVILVILINFIIIMVSFFQHIHGYQIIQIILLAFYTFECVLRIFGEGPEQFIADQRNWLDVEPLLLSFGLLGASDDTSIIVRKVARVVRLFRLNRIVRIFWRNEFFRKKIYLNTYYCKLRLLFNQLYICVVIGMKMFPLFMTCFYVLSVIGMERFDNRFGVESTSPYAIYDNYSSFRNLVQAHLICVQVMIEAGWSPIVYDYADRYQSFGEVVIFFVCIHICIVIILVSLMKGMVADFYETIYNKYEQVLRVDLNMLQQEKQEQQRKKQYKQIRDSYNCNTEMKQDTLKKKEIRQAKKDREMIEKLKHMLKQKQLRSPIRAKKNRTIGLVQDNSVKDLLKFKKTMVSNNSTGVYQSRIQIVESNSQHHFASAQEQLPQIEESLCDEDIDILEDEFVDRVILKEEDTPFSPFPFYPKFLKSFISSKLKPVKSINFPLRLSESSLVDDRKQKMLDGAVQSFVMDKHRIGENPQSNSFYTHTLETLLHIQKPEQDRKKQILHDILKEKASSEAEIQRRIKKKYKHNDRVEINGIVRRVYLSNTNRALIEKFQIEHFSDIYGNSFKQLSRVTLYPILKHEARLMDVLSKVMRYSQTNLADFFHILATIEYKISNSLVKKGSIFKFVFEVEELGENWFAIEVKENKSLRLHFLKSSIWIYEKDMIPDEIYYANDIFAYDSDEFPGSDRSSNNKIIRLLYNNFESLGFSMLSETNFFNSDPNDHVYDLYSFVLNVGEQKSPLKHQSSNIQNLVRGETSDNNSKILSSSMEDERNGPFTLKITKIMLVILSKENERPKNKKLPYRLTSLKTILDNKIKKKVDPDFCFDNDQNEIYQKLKNLAAEDEQKIAQSQGLPYAFIIDMMLSVKNILTIHKNNFIDKVEQVLNIEFNKDTSVNMMQQ